MAHNKTTSSSPAIGGPDRRSDVEIKPLQSLNEDHLKRLIVGYTTAEAYQVSKEETDDYVKLELKLQPLKQAMTKRYHELDAEALREYLAMAEQGHSFGAYVDERLVGIALSEMRAWNSTLWIQEFHVLPEYQGRGIGRQLMDAAVREASTCGLRAIVCETQVSNVPAIKFYRAMEFRVDGLDLTYYSNDDQERGEVAVFMKRRIPVSGH